MKPKKLYKTIISVEVLSDEKIPEETSLAKVLYETEEGMWSGIEKWKRNVEITGQNAVKECEVHGTDPDFFMMDYNGNELHDE